jgi:hypothetical protein
VCQRITGEPVDQAVSDVLVETMTPWALEVALSVQQELQSRLEEADRLRKNEWSGPAMRPNWHSDDT